MVECCLFLKLSLVSATYYNYSLVYSLTISTSSEVYQYKYQPQVQV